MTRRQHSPADLEQLVREARKCSGQLSYGRRAPSAEARPLLERARRSLFARLQGNPDKVVTLRLLAEVEEMLLNYRAALAYLERALALGSGPSKKDLKRLASYRSLAQEWAELDLTATELQSLGADLQTKLGLEPHDRSRKWTREWIRRNCPDRESEIMNALDARGAYSDHQVLTHVVKS